MKLYYTPGACSMAPHILLHEAGIEHASEIVDLAAKKTASGADYWSINPKGAVPAIDLGKGEVLTENAAILQYIGDQSGNPTLLAPVGDLARYRVIEWLTYISSEVHKSFSPLFNPALGAEAAQVARDTVAKKFDFVESQLGDRPYLTGNNLSIADPYLFVMTGWAGHTGIDLARWPKLVAFRERMLERPAVQTVLKAEGLV